MVGVFVIGTVGATSRFGSPFFQGRGWIFFFVFVLVFVTMLVLVLIAVLVSMSVTMPVRVTVMVMHARVTDEHEQTDQIHTQTGSTDPHDEQRVLHDCNLDEPLYGLYSNVETGGDEKDAVDQTSNNFRSTPAVRELAALLALGVLDGNIISKCC